MEPPATATTLTLPWNALVVLAGPPACGKSTFARQHFTPTQILSSDTVRGWLCDDESEQSVSSLAFSVMYDLVSKRLGLRRLTVVDSTALQAATRRDLRGLARRAGVPVVLIVLVADAALCEARDRGRARQVGPAALAHHLALLQDTLLSVPDEGFDAVYLLDAVHLEAVTVQIGPSPADRRELAGPFGIIGDIHGCYDELTSLLTRLGYGPRSDGVGAHPAGRTAIFLGDLTDRGPGSVPVLQRVIPMVKAGTALYTPGNHCNKLMRYFVGRKVQIAYGLDRTLAEFAALPPDEEAALVAATRALVAQAPPYLWLDGGRLVVTHAGITEEMIGGWSRRIERFCLYGDVSGEQDAAGHPIRRDWAQDYGGAATVVYGHTVVPAPTWVNNTINIDQGCVFGGHLTALRWPERQIVQVPAAHVYTPRDG